MKHIKHFGDRKFNAQPKPQQHTRLLFGIVQQFDRTFKVPLALIDNLQDGPAVLELSPFKGPFEVTAGECVAFGTSRNEKKTCFKDSLVVEISEHANGTFHVMHWCYASDWLKAQQALKVLVPVAVVVPVVIKKAAPAPVVIRKVAPRPVGPRFSKKVMDFLFPPSLEDLMERCFQTSPRLTTG